MLNGSSSHFPPHHRLLTTGLRPDDLSLLDGVATLGPTTLVLHHDGDPEGAWRQALSRRADVRELGEEPGWSLYALAARAAPEPRVGRPLPIVAAEASHEPDALRFCFDADLRSVWSSRRAQAGAEEIRLDLGAPRRIAALRLSLARHFEFYPRELRIEIGTDGRSWLAAWEGRVAQAAFRAAVEDPRSVPLSFDLGGREARYVRLRQLAADVVSWNVAELELLGGAE